MMLLAFSPQNTLLVCYPMLVFGVCSEDTNVFWLVMCADLFLPFITSIEKKSGEIAADETVLPSEQDESSRADMTVLWGILGSTRYEDDGQGSILGGWQRSGR